MFSRVVRRAAGDEGGQIARIPIYPELRGCAAPTADRIFEIFAHVSRHELRDTAGNLIQVFEPELTELQLKILDFLGIPPPSTAEPPNPGPPPANPGDNPTEKCGRSGGWRQTVKLEPVRADCRICTNALW